ncbi:MAG TPA: AAA family ATPase [Acidimicrobiia bacterium]
MEPTQYIKEVQSFGAFLPMDRARELVGMSTVPVVSQGTALYADISGFTRLTEELGRTLGPRRGAEELTVYLTRVFEPVTTTIAQHGGSVISFGGDSVICWFQDDDGWQATSAALELVRIVRDLGSRERGPGRALDIKVAVAWGTGNRRRVGSPADAYMDVLDGPVVDTLVQAFSGLSAGDVGVSAAVAEANDSRVRIRSQSENGKVRYIAESVLERPPTVKEDVWSLDEVAADDWLLPYIRDHVQHGLGGLMGQLREVVNLFVGFGAENPDTGGPYETFDALVSKAQEVVSSYEGMVLQVLVDEKGRHLHAVFGASMAHEDEARRAVVAALDLVRVANEQIRIGVASGAAYVGAYGGSSRMTLGVIGPSVNLAARLMQTARAGSVYVSSRVAEQARPHIEFEEVGPVNLKGLDHAVVVHRAKPSTPRAEESARPTRAIGRLIGRDREREVLAAGLARLQGGDGSTFIIEGPAGIGKSRLLADFIDQATLMGSKVIETAGQEIEHASGFFVWRSVLRQLFGGDETAESRLLEFVNADPWRADRIGLLDSIVSTPMQDTYLTAGMEPSLRMENTQQLISAIVRDAPRTAPLVVVLDDGHWIDSLSWAMAERIGIDIPSLMVVIGTRPFSVAAGAPPPDEYQRLLEVEGTSHILLEELGADEALELVEMCLGVKSLPGPVSELIVEQAGGHPYFSEEIGFALRDAGLLILEDGESRLAPAVHDLSEIDFPRSVHEMITGRFDRLPVQQQSVLKVASVIGREFTVETLAVAYPGTITGEEVDRLLLALVPLDLIEPIDSDAGRYRFRHAITRDIAYGMLLFSQRHELHRAVARAMEDEFVEDLDSVLAPLAHHSRNSLSPASSGEDVDRALDYLGKAGRRSLRSFAHREAIGFLSDALAIASGSATGDLAGVKPGEPVSDRILARWEQDLAEAQLGMGRVDQSAAHFEHALELHGHPIGKGRVGVATSLLSAVALQTGHRIVGGGGRAMGDERRDDLIEAATAYERLMKIYYYANDPGSLVTAAVSGLNLAERAGTSPVLARIYANMSIVAGIIPLHRLAQTYRRRSREVADEVDRMTEHAWVRLATSVYGVGVGDWTRVEPELKESYDLYKRLSDWRQLAENLGTTAQMLTARGRYAEVYSIGEELRDLGSWRDDAQAETWGWLFQGTSLLRQGDHEEAISRFHNAERLLHAGVGGANVGWLHGLMAETYSRRSNPDRARAAAASAAESLYSERPAVIFALDGFTGAAEATFALWVSGSSRTAAASKAAADRAVKKLAGYGKVFPIGRPAALRYSGRLKEQTGNKDGALNDWARALRAAEGLDMPFEAALTMMNMGRLTGDRGQLEQSRERFSKLGTRHFIELTDQALSAL